ncbi:helix-turn-helix transcriptional regulator [Planctomonas sp. JC2975]|uniref:helix-turn-helix domain-containing protein n=1 Tax=Planctomonas sp. JC2975 TaxID=2729626 RepID=UPI0014736CAB|nr:helix-turn-helix transcriptional regulator [Planctomonas sp. JC2975]NNC12829.1 helix-turn-helix transcriptional regulator [Planctomonas sp. JC2975]
MADSGDTNGIGQRVKALRRERGFKSPRDLAAAIPGGNVTMAVLENLESGRKADVSVSHLLNIARALHVPPSYLLASVATPDASLDLPNLGDDFADMTAGEFDAWFSGTLGGDYRSTDPSERVSLMQLQAYRTLSRLTRELVRLSAIQDSRPDAEQPSEDSRLSALQAEIAELTDYLKNAGWTLSS